MAKERRTFRFSDETMQKLIELAAAQNRSMTNYLETLVEREYERLEGNKMKKINMKLDDLSYDVLVRESNKTYDGEYLPTTFFTSDGYMISYDISACNQDPTSNLETIVFSWNKGEEHGVDGRQGASYVRKK